MKVFAPDWQKHCIQAAYEKQPFTFANSRAPFETTLMRLGKLWLELCIEISSFFGFKVVWHVQWKSLNGCFLQVAWICCFRQSGEETFITVVNYDSETWILSKKMSNLTVSSLLISCPKVRHDLSLELLFSKSAARIALIIYPTNSQHLN